MQRTKIWGHVEQRIEQRMNAEVDRLRVMLVIEYEIQRLMLEQLNIEWTPGEPFYSLIEDEIERLRADNKSLYRDLAEARAELERVRVALRRLQADLEPDAGYYSLRLSDAREIIEQALGEAC